LGQIVSREEALNIRDRLRAEGRSVVLTNGLFDLLHVGHVDYLQRARELGDVLVIGLNSDDSARRLRGEKRPIVPQQERACLVAALACVDYVTIFEEDTAEKLVETLQPDVYVKGGDYVVDGEQGAGKALPEARIVTAYGGEVRVLPYLPGYSTTTIIETVLQRYRESNEL
jgi:rfaE bifunctional protein nucleotidyltransferase chain/domain